MEQAVRQEFEDRFPIPEGIEWRPSDYFPIHTENVHEYICRCGRASRYADMWQAWKASRAALRVELPPSVTIEEVAEHLGMDDVDVVDIAHMVNGAIAACAAFIKQAGIEVKP
ncbi:hypothetical protein [Pseudomonas aeruginosa]|uniref:hypothetical protein n=1 Tax=Pseudomonas aeruginosa TaxID=287 RepID=UPI0007398A28|nr:hypothetical protein [Pseudomonas aeruginosa]KUG33347.1 hypothetical protein AUQ38_13230 [Pseudomonas aeruginosa]OWI55527.1 hypothetical protein CDC23_30480 [Pseudomonas aeruginosa]OWI59840.1 hypothetical protein CDC24_14650 [Pseudomonas aeruginosa]HCF0810249.1 hypothetical protein [Pseudomonas aeruginosa]